MKLNREELAKTSTLTLDHYNERAEAFWEGTRDHDVSQNIAAMLRYIEGEPRFTSFVSGMGRCGNEAYIRLIRTDLRGLVLDGRL
jgi:hypothetical protein